MLKLYKKTPEAFLYHEAWASGSIITEHWGVVGERGESREHKRQKKLSEEDDIIRVLKGAIDDGFVEIEPEDHATLMIEFRVDGMGSPSDLDKRHRLEERMNETLGWTGLGACDGGSIGSGTMEVCCFVVDFEIGRRVVERDIGGTEFFDFSRIYDENAD